MNARYVRYDTERQLGGCENTPLRLGGVQYGCRYDHHIRYLPLQLSVLLIQCCSMHLDLKGVTIGLGRLSVHVHYAFGMHAPGEVGRHHRCC